MKHRIKHFWDLRCTFGFQYTGSLRVERIYIDGFYAEVGNTLFMYDVCGDIMNTRSGNGFVVGTYGYLGKDGWNPMISHSKNELLTWSTVDL